MNNPITNEQQLLTAMEINEPEVIKTIRIGLGEGRRFIILQHKDRNKVRTSISGVDALRLVSEYNASAGGEVTSTKIVGGECIFVPDNNTKVRYGFLLDTDRNRDILATHMREARWITLSSEVLEDVEERRIKIEGVNGEKAVHDTSLNNVSVGAQQHIVPPSNTFKMVNKGTLEKQLQEKEAELARLREALEEKADEPTAEDTNTMQTPYGMSYEDAKNAVHKKEHATISAIQRLHPKNWWKTNEYRQKIQPQIEALTNVPAPQVVQKEEEPVAQE